LFHFIDVKSTTFPIVVNEKNTQEGIQFEPITESNQEQAILLPAILGSVGILGFVAVAIAISIVWTRKKRPG